MPWSEVSVVDQRRRFIEDVRLGVFTLRELCARYDVSRPTGYLWVARFEQEGRAGLSDRSHRPHGCPHATPAHVWQAVRRARHEHPSWGPKKLLWLVAKRLDDELPAPSTVAGWLKRNGLVAARRRRPQRPHPGQPHGQASAPNGLWTIDFKGHFRTRDGRYCYPLTVVDAYSRYVLACQGLLHPTRRLTTVVLERLFREYGLPERLRSDNGAPFASMALARLSKLSAWWIRLGITPELIEPGHPEQNPRHERMHRTLKDDTTRPPGRDVPGPAGPVSPLAEAIQRRAAARVAPTAAPGNALPPVAAVLSGAPGGSRIPRPLRSPTREPQRRHSLGKPPRAGQPLHAGGVYWLRTDRRRSVGCLLLSLPAGSLQRTPRAHHR